MEITHKIRDGWRWTDGTPVTPADIIYTWKLIMDPEFQIPARDQTEKIYEVEAVDDQTYIVKLMSQDQVRAAAAGTLEGEVDFSKRTACSDGNCIGIIGPDGKCTECGKPYGAASDEDEE